MSRQWTDHDPASQRLIRARDRTRSAILRKTYERAIERRRTTVEHRAALRGHEAFPLLPEDGFNGPLHLGTTPNCIDIGLHPDDFLGTTAILGFPGTGKSWLLDRLVHQLAQQHWVLSVDTKGTLPRDFGHTLPLLSPAQAAHTLRPPPGTNAERWLTILMWLLESCTYLAHGSTVIRATVKRLRAQGRAADVCFAEIAADLLAQAQRAKTYKDHAYILSAAMATSRITQGDLGLFSSAAMLDWDVLLSQPHCQNMHGVPAEAARLAVLSAAQAFMHRQRHLGLTDRRLRGVLAIDDARVLLRDLGRTQTSGAEPFQAIHDTGATAGLGTIVAVQSGAEIGPHLLTAARNLIVVGPVDGSELRQFQERMALTDDQARALLRQDRFHAVCHFKLSPWKLPFPICLADTPPALSDAERERVREAKKQALLGGFQPVPWSSGIGSSQATGGRSSSMSPPPRTRAKAVSNPTAAASSASTPTSSNPPAPPSATPSPPQPIPSPLDPDAHRVLTILLDSPHLLQSELGAKAGIAGRRITRVRGTLEQAQVIRSHRMGRYAIWEPLPAAAQRLGLQHTPLAGSGGYGHKFIQARVAKWLAKTHPVVHTEHPWNGGKLDVFARSAAGDQLAFEIVLSWSNINSVLTKLAAFPGATTVVVRDTKEAKRLRKHMAANPLFVRTSLKVLTLKQIIAQTKP